MATSRQDRQDLTLYLRSMLLVSAVVGTAMTIQILFVYHEIHANFFIAPTVVTLIGTLLIGRLAVLRTRLQRKSAEFRAIVDIAQEFTFLRKVSGEYEYVSPSCEQLTGYNQQEFYQHPHLMSQLIHPDDQPRWANHVHHINDAGAPESFDVRLVTKSGETVWITHICAPVYNEVGQQIGVRSTNLDITQRKLDQARIERMAHYDPLTELPNRRLLQQQMHQLIDAKQSFAVLFLDLSRFKNINDSMGHSFGDALLRTVARRLQTACPDDTLLSRFGGDEFVIVRPQLNDNGAALNFSQMLLTEIERPIVIDHSEFHISGTIGIARYPEDASDSETLIRNADTAMYRAKRSGEQKIFAYHADYSREAAEFVSTESEIYRALQHNEFIPFYQPKVDLESGSIVALEALARWQHPERGLVPPNQFIGIAEETGQIAEVGKHILEQVVTDLVRWRLLGCAVPVAINISPRQFADREFWQLLQQVIEDGSCEPGSIELEITEQVFMGDIENTAQRLTELRHMGFTVALDDFGTGYSSFNYLRNLPIDAIKLDRSFISHLEHEPASQAILQAMIGICTRLDMTLIAEGVETEQQRAMLLEYGCRQVQGFLFHRPLPAGEIEQLLSQQV